MKKLYFYSLLALMATGCRSDKPGPDPDTKRESYTVRFNVNPERVSIEEAPMSTISKVAGVDLYGIQVWEEVDDALVPYAYGLFDDESKMTLTLMSAGKYRFEMTLFPNGMETIKPDVQGNYRAPFVVTGVKMKLTNTFTLTADALMSELNIGSAYSYTWNTNYERPPVSRFHGVVENYTPVKDGTVDMDLKWVVFGLTVIPEGLTEGKLTVEMEGAPVIEITPDDPTAVEKRIYTFKRTDPDTDDWHHESYSETIPMKITWEKADATKEVLLDTNDPNPIQFRRRVERIIRVQLSSSPIDNGMVIGKEDASLEAAEEIVIKG